MALAKKYMTLTTKLLTRNSIPLCIRAEHANKETRDYPYLWRAQKDIPTTPEEIAKTAEKYNLHPREYKSYEEYSGYGDYPKLPLVGAEAQDPFYPWDYPPLRRNFGEALHIHQDQIGEDRFSAGVQPLVPYKQSTIMFCGTMLIASILFIIFEYFPWFQPVMEKQYPKPGVTHYTFEPSR